MAKYSDRNHQALTASEVQRLYWETCALLLTFSTDLKVHSECYCSACFAGEESEGRVTCLNPCGDKTPNPPKLQRPAVVI